MDALTQSKPQRFSLPSYRQLLWFFVPLALSSSLMTLEPLIINTALSHAPNAELMLAAYNVMFGISLVVEAPVIMLVSASTALSKNQQAFGRLFRFMLILSSGAVATGFLVSLTPLYDWLVVDAMRIPPAVAEAARPALVIMSVWSLPVAWRRTLQGVLIAHDRTPVVTLATGVRLVALTAALLIGIRLMPHRVLEVSALAMQASVLAESLVVTPPAFRLVRSMPSGSGESPLSWKWLISFYQPLAIMMILRQVSRPILSAGIASASSPEASLAAWSVTWSLVVLPFGVTMGLEQVAIAKGITPDALRRVRRFVWAIGLALGGGLALVAFTPLVDPVLATLFAPSPEIKPLVVTALRWTALLPLLQSLQAMLRGIAIGDGRTPDVRSAVLVSLIGTTLIAVFGPRVSFCTGVVIGSVGTMVAALAEVSWLAWREVRSVPSSVL